MSETMRLLNSHASVRRFTGQEISEEDELNIIYTAERSPTSSNLHAYSIVGVRSPETRTKLAELSGGQRHVIDCSLFLVFCADLYRLKTLTDKRGYRFNGDTAESLLIATVDAALAASRALIAAQALGLGGVMVGGIRNRPDEVCELLGLPEGTYPVMGMSLGYPEAEPKIKPRLPINGLYFREQYRADVIPNAIEEYDNIIEELGYLSGREVEPEQYPEFRGRYNWSEHSARRMASERPGVQRPHMLRFLRSRGLIKR